MTSADDDQETRAAKRYFLMNGTRVGAIVAVLLGLAIARSVVEAPYALGVALAVGGMLVFFFAPPLMARRWKSKDSEEHRDSQ